MLAIVHDGAELKTVTHLLHFIDCHMPEKMKTPVLAWLIENKLIGKRLKEFFNDTCKTSLLSFHSELLSRTKRNEKHPVMFGKDFV